MKSLLTLLAKFLLIPLRLLAGMLTADVATEKKILGLGIIALIISNQ